jgi:hypothetical protein
MEADMSSQMRVVEERLERCERQLECLHFILAVHDDVLCLILREVEGELHVE